MDSNPSLRDDVLLEGEGALARLVPKRAKPLLLSAIAAKDSREIAALLRGAPWLPEHAEPGGFDPVAAAISHGDSEGLALVLGAGFYQGQTPSAAWMHLDLCARRGKDGEDDGAKMRELLRHGWRARVNERPFVGQGDPPTDPAELARHLAPPPLLLALDGRRFSAWPCPFMARALLEAGADPSVEGPSGDALNVVYQQLSSLSYQHSSHDAELRAKRQALGECFGLLLEFGLPFGSTFGRDKTPLASLMLRLPTPARHGAVFEALAAHCGGDTSWIGPWGQALCQDPQGDPALAQELISLGWRPMDAVAGATHTYWDMYLAAFERGADPSLCAALLDAGADIQRATGYEGEASRTLLERALLAGDEAIVRLAIARGAELSPAMARPRKGTPPRIRAEIRKRVGDAFGSAMASIEALLAAEWDRREVFGAAQASASARPASKRL